MRGKFAANSLSKVLKLSPWAQHFLNCSGFLTELKLRPDRSALRLLSRASHCRFGCAAFRDLHARRREGIQLSGIDNGLHQFRAGALGLLALWLYVIGRQRFVRETQRRMKLRAGRATVC